MILKELLNTIDRDSYVLLECFEPIFSNNDNRAFGFYADYITSVDPDADREVITYDLKDEEDYSTTILSNTCVSADFSEWHDNKNAKVLCVLLKKGESE